MIGQKDSVYLAIWESYPFTCYWKPGYFLEIGIFWDGNWIVGMRKLDRIRFLWC